MRQALGNLIDDGVQIPEILLSMCGVGEMELIVDCAGDRSGVDRLPVDGFLNLLDDFQQINV